MYGLKWAVYERMNGSSNLVAAFETKNDADTFLQVMQSRFMRNDYYVKEIA